ncbi:MerR family transcriptional regulator [Bosea sp. 685]|uniref:MerR family transcriptional regulator n=1 Tax=Bosea sp. 685 TaxID=3080057 RepID=UPI002892BD00|nr:MerR family transcriptional regulator [Bosea sp. 685]WNJ88115.1 MerR family transcriptional regulator [Bosea sp. 685]
MVKRRIVLISEFARATGLTTDTVRFYVRLGLLRPGAGTKGGRHPYQIFSESDLRAAERIRLSQAAGLSLKEIAILGAERRAGRMTSERRIEVVSAQIDKLEAKAAELKAMADYLRAKRTWLVSGEQGAEPT